MVRKSCILVLLAACLMAAPLVAQRGGRVGGGGFRGGFGHAGFVRGGVSFGLGFGFRWGYPYGYYYPSYYSYAPYYYTPSYYAPYYYAPAPRPVEVYYAPQRALPAPVADERPLTLLVFRDETIYLAREYRVEGDRLHYVTNYGVAKDVPLASLNIESTRQLNNERHVAVDLPR